MHADRAVPETGTDPISSYSFPEAGTDHEEKHSWVPVGDLPAVLRLDQLHVVYGVRADGSGGCDVVGHVVDEDLDRRIGDVATAAARRELDHPILGHRPQITCWGVVPASEFA